MTRQEAEDFIKELTEEQKIKLLNLMLSFLQENP